MTFLYDQFTGADNTVITSRSPDTGPDWAHWTVSGGSATAGVILGNRAGNNGAATAAYNTRLISSSDAATADYSISSQVYVASLTRQSGLMVRCQSAAYTGYLAFIDATGVLTLYRINTGTLTSLGTWSLSWAAGETHTVLLSASGTGAAVALTVNVDGTDRITYSDTSAARITSAGRAGIWLGGGSQFRLDDVTAAALSASSSVTVTPPANLRVFQRSSGYSSVVISGTYVGAPTSIQARVVEDGTSTEIVSWATLDAAPSGGAFSGSISVPEGGWYNVEVRQYPDTTVSASSSNKFGVGAVFSVAGQSNAMQWFSIGSGTPDTHTAKYAGSFATNTGAGAIAFANAMEAALGVPVALVDTGANGAALTSAGDRGSGYWLDTSGTAWTTWTARTTAVGGKLEGICWLQGESDALQGVAQSVYSAGLATLFASMRSHLGQSSLPIFISPLPRSGHADGTDAEWNAINDAILSFSAADTFIACDTWDLSMADTLHYDATGYAAVAARFALAVRAHNGDSVYSRGPSVSSVVAVDSTTLDIVVTHLGGADISPSSGATGFRVEDGTGAVTPTAVARTDATHFRMTFSSALVAPVVVAVAWGEQPSVTDPARDNTGLPVQKTLSSGVVESVSLSASSTATASGTADISAGVEVGGSGAANADGSATISTGNNIALQAAGASVSTGSGQSAVAVAASAIGVAVTEGAAGLTATITITAAGLAEAAGAAGLTVSSGGELLANGVAVASGAAALVVSINLQATGSAESGGSAALVSGAAEVTLSGAGYVQALGAGQLQVAIDLVATGGGAASGSGVLEVASIRILSVRPFGRRRPRNISSGRRAWH